MYYDFLRMYAYGRQDFFRILFIALKMLFLKLKNVLLLDENDAITSHSN